MDIQIGKVTHYFDKIGVAIVQVTNQPLKVGDQIKFTGHDQKFSQKVLSLQIEQSKVNEVAVGESCGIKTDKAVKEGDQVFLITSKE